MTQNEMIKFLKLDLRFARSVNGLHKIQDSCKSYMSKISLYKQARSLIFLTLTLDSRSPLKIDLDMFDTFHSFKQTTSKEVDLGLQQFSLKFVERQDTD